MNINMNLQENIRRILREETNPIIRRIFRRIDPEKMDKIFGDGLDTMMIRYHQNKHNWTKMNLDKFKSAIVSYVIVDLCIKYSEICFGAEEYYNKVWEFLLNNYSDVMEEKWKEIVSGEINESIEDGKKVYYGYQIFGPTTKIMSKVISILKIRIMKIITLIISMIWMFSLGMKTPFLEQEDCQSDTLTEVQNHSIGIMKNMVL